MHRYRVTFAINADGTPVSRLASGLAYIVNADSPAGAKIAAYGRLYRAFPVMKQPPGLQDVFEIGPAA